MKMMKRMQTVALSVALTGLSTLPVWAFTGQVDPSAVTPDTVTCINYTTNESVPGQLLSSGQFDCSGLDFQQGERIGVVLSGLAGSDGTMPPAPGGCQPLQEQAGTGFTDVGMLASNQCVAIKGQIDSPFNNQDANTWDIFRVTLSGPTNVSLQLEPGGNGGWGLYIGDPQTGQLMACENVNCQATLSAQVVDVIVVADAPAPYRLSIGAGASGGVAGLAMRSEVDRPTLTLRIPAGVY